MQEFGDAIHSSLTSAATEGLYVLRSTLLLDVCGYLHESHLAGASLIWESPALAGLSPTETYDFMVALHAAARRARERDDVVATELLNWPVFAIPSSGSASSGIHIVGRSSPWTPEEQDLAVRLCRGLAAGLHAADANAAIVGRRPRVRVAAAPGGYLAEAQLLAGERELCGSAIADDWRVAAASAVCDAFGSPLPCEVVQFRASAVDGVVVLLEDGQLRGVGAALQLAGTDESQVVADAALAAYHSLASASPWADEAAGSGPAAPESSAAPGPNSPDALATTPTATAG